MCSNQHQRCISTQLRTFFVLIWLQCWYYSILGWKYSGGGGGGIQWGKGGDTVGEGGGYSGGGGGIRRDSDEWGNHRRIIYKLLTLYTHTVSHTQKYDYQNNFLLFVTKIEYQLCWSS
jgi:hypothetical protein